MKILLVGINAKYIHSNLAILSLSTYASRYLEFIKRKEYTINQYTDDILQDIYKEKPDFIGFSCYIWNMNMVSELCRELRKILPALKIWLGGPEVSFDAKEQLKRHNAVDGIMVGEGEETFLELLNYYMDDGINIDKIKGIAYKQSACKQIPHRYHVLINDTDHDKVCNIENDPAIIDTATDDTSAGYIYITPLRPEMDLSKIPFPYYDLGEFENKIIYYETSRGCPYSCSYCLSSIDKKVRLRDISLVKKELQTFLDYKVPQVKFVDRTFNCNREHALSIWKYIHEHDNGVTNFHFEVSADILREEEILLLASMREGLVQLEIGVQSTNLDTVKAIKRQMNLEKLKAVVEQIHRGHNVHQHLDLIAGLPFEDFASFKNSFNEVYVMKPDQFQLGFLKVLKGSLMYEESEKWGIAYKSIPPYEVLYTNWLSYDDILALKKIEDMVEVYYNSGQFQYSILYLLHFFQTPFDFYRTLGDYYRDNGLEVMNHSRLKRYEILIDFYESILSGQINTDIEAFKSILVHDLYCREKLKSRPYFANDYIAYKKLFREFYYDTEKVSAYIEIDPKNTKAEQLKQRLHVEHYDINVRKTAQTGVVLKEEQFVLYDYEQRSSIHAGAKVYELSQLA